MKISISFFIVASCACLAPVAAQAAPAKARLVGHVVPAGSTEKSVVMLGGAYFPGKGYRTDIQSKWALYPGVQWQLFGLNGVGPQVASERGQKNDVPVGYMAELRHNVTGDEAMIAISNASPAAQPRLPKMQSLYQEVYQRVAADLLRSKGLNISRAKLVQLMRVDLNGDGIEEVLMAARSRPDYGKTAQEKKGDYSMLAIRYLDKGVVRARLLDWNISKRDVSFSAPGYFEVLSCVDVDGDGAMEIVGANGYYEGQGFEVWKFDGRGVKSVLNAGWGV